MPDGLLGTGFTRNLFTAGHEEVAASEASRAASGRKALSARAMLLHDETRPPLVAGSGASVDFNLDFTGIAGRASAPPA